MDLSGAAHGSMHDFGLFKYRGLPPALEELLFLMGRVIVWADSAYEALGKLYPNWQARVQEKARRNHPLNEQQKWNNTARSKVRILIEHVIRRLKIFRCCSERTRKVSQNRHSRYWNMVAGLWNQRQAQRLEITDVFD